jgi:sec-independent protein translocase protein TatA
MTLLTGLLQPSHLMLVLIVALIFLGPKRIPEAGRAVGQGLKEFKRSVGRDEEHGQLPADPGTVHAEPPPAGEAALRPNELN